MLRSSSFAAKSSVTVPYPDMAPARSSAAGFESSSSTYLERNPSNLSGSWLNHFLRSPDGATSFAHIPRASLSLDTPLGHRRSTRMRKPSSSEGSA